MSDNLAQKNKTKHNYWSIYNKTISLFVLVKDKASDFLNQYLYFDII